MTEENLTISDLQQCQNYSFWIENTIGSNVTNSTVYSLVIKVSESEFSDFRIDDNENLLWKVTNSECIKSFNFSDSFGHFKVVEKAHLNMSGFNIPGCAQIVVGVIPIYKTGTSGNKVTSTVMNYTQKAILEDEVIIELTSTNFSISINFTIKKEKNKCNYKNIDITINNNTQNTSFSKWKSLLPFTNYSCQIVVENFVGESTIINRTIGTQEASKIDIYNCFKKNVFVTVSQSRLNSIKNN